MLFLARFRHGFFFSSPNSHRLRLSRAGHSCSNAARKIRLPVFATLILAPFAAASALAAPNPQPGLTNMFNNILIVCIGNICRSPMAEAVFKYELSQHGVHTRIESAGVAALAGRGADPVVQELLRERGIDLVSHRARQLTPSLITEFDLVLTMDNEQTKTVESILPSARGRVHRLGKWSGFDVPDPYKKPRQAFERALVLIDQGVADWKQKFWTPGIIKNNQE